MAGIIPEAATADPFRSYLLERGLVPKPVLDRAEAAARETGATLAGTLVDLGYMSDEACADALAASHQLPRFDPEQDRPAAPVAEAELPARFLRRHMLLPLAVDPAGLALATADPTRVMPVRAAELALGGPARLKVATLAEVRQALDSLYPGDRAGAGETTDDGAVAGDVEALRDRASDAPVVRLVAQLFEEAVARGASDIHLEPAGPGLRVRWRVHGRMVEADAPPPQLRAAMLSRIKLLAGMDIAEFRLPQDGRIKTIVRGRPIDMRVATLPAGSLSSGATAGAGAEAITIRVLDRNAVQFDLARLGFDQEAIRRLRALARTENGLVLVTGPTGSGKTTTLYTLMDELRSGPLKIITVEDPIEFQFDGLVQVQVRSEIGLDFASVLRATLRHNPDVLLVGEIRDRETAQVAIQAALTGHLVLSTVHTNSSLATVTRLLDMGVDPYLVAATLAGVVAQRLVPTLCPACALPDPPAGAALARWLPDFEPDGAMPMRPAGCARCGGSGYAGRAVAFEILEVTPALREGIGSNGDFARAAAEAPGFVPLERMAMRLVAEGRVALADVLKATQLGF